MLTICEGLDRVGKTTVANYFESLGYQVVHMSAPPKDQTADSFLQEMVDLVSSAANKDIFLDRSYYGEALVWPQIYGRKSLLSEDDLIILRELEDSVGVTRMFMTDADPEAHWARCVANNEPLTKVQFTRARSLYSRLALTYNFEHVTLPKFVERFKLDPKTIKPAPTALPSPGTDLIKGDSKPSDTSPKKTEQQLVLEKANAINDILDKRILKQRGSMYDELETDIREHLNTRLGKLLGHPTDSASLTPEETSFMKTLYKRAMEKNKGDK